MPCIPHYLNPHAGRLGGEALWLLAVEKELGSDSDCLEHFQFS